MTQGEDLSVGLVIPAYRPDVYLLLRYIEDLDARLEPDMLRVELDDPLPETVESLHHSGVKVNSVSVRRGKGRAITDGFKALGTSILGFADADGSTPAAEVERVISAVQHHDIAVGSRRHPDSEIVTPQHWIRSMLGATFAKLAQAALDVKLHDYMCGAKAIRGGVWEVIEPDLEAHGFGWDIELLALAQAAGYTIAEVPIRWEDRIESRVSVFRDSRKMLKTLLRTRKRVSRMTDAMPDGGRPMIQGKGDV